VLPNDPLVAALTPQQMEWIIWNLAQEAKTLKESMPGFGNKGITGAHDMGFLESFIDKDEG
jgi:hypothetical protein